MKNSSKIILVGVSILAIAFGVYLFTHQNNVDTQAVSPTGTTNTSARIASIVFAPTTGSATSTSILNDGGSDRAIVSSFLQCNTVGTSKTAYTGAGLASLLFRIATTSAVITNSLPDINANYAANMLLATSTVDSFVATSTEGGIQGTSRLWPVSTYLTMQPNATNTASCTIGVYYIQL